MQVVNKIDKLKAEFGDELGTRRTAPRLALPLSRRHEPMAARSCGGARRPRPKARAGASDRRTSSGARLRPKAFVRHCAHARPPSC